MSFKTSHPRQSPNPGTGTPQNASQGPKRTRQPASLHPASGSDHWTTPEWLADLLGRFDLDPCSNARSHVQAGQRCDPAVANPSHRDGLAFDWGGSSVFVNPPYSDVGPWAVKLVEHQGPWAALVKLDPTTRWWATLMSAGPTVAPFRKRITFESGLDTATTANFPSVLVWNRWAPCVTLQGHLWLWSWR